MKLKEQFPQSRLDAAMVLQREEEIIKKIEAKEFSKPGKYSVDSVGKWCTRAWIYPDDPTDVKVLAGELGELFDVVWELDFREKEGTFYYKGRKEDYWEKGEAFLVLVEDVPTPPNCKIVEKVETVKRFKKVCDKEEVIVE